MNLQDVAARLKALGFRQMQKACPVVEHSRSLNLGLSDQYPLITISPRDEEHQISIIRGLQKIGLSGIVVSMAHYEPNERKHYYLIVLIRYQKEIDAWL